MLDLFCGRGGWTNTFLDRGWEVVGVDLVRSPDYRGEFLQFDVLELQYLKEGFWAWVVSCALVRSFDFICASSPCEQFSVHGMKHFHPNPPYPELGIKLFNHTREICETSGIPYIMENVRAAQKFVGPALHHCGPFYLWGTGVPPLLNQGIRKGLNMDRDPITGKRALHLGRRSSHNSKARAADKAITATIPPELANCVADYAERIISAEKER
jgi:hypothetical protein